ncbi:MAG: PQQ-dependent sugar dehydrogenase [Pedobacter sp.]|nr:MAG: PQQ-dependent sugar dehydrogenase [Pedobacter sp.]
MKVFVGSLILVFFFTSCKKNSSNKESDNPQVVVLKSRVITSNLINPWEIIYGPDNYIWVTEKAGKISRINPESGQITNLLTISDVRVNGEGGLLGMVMHPNFGNSPFIYVVYDYGTNYKAKVVRYSYNNGTLINPQILIDQIPASSIHNGSRLIISANKIYISTGDANDTATPQNINSLSGKILRLNLDGSIPADNPIPNNAVWSLGHRNAQGLVFVGNKLFSSEHGPDSDDEINIIEKGKNYGWPSVKGFCNEPAEQPICTANNIVEPLIAWTPTIAPSGLSYYNANYLPQFKNSLLLTLLKGSKLMQLKLNDDQTKIVSTKDYYINEFGRLRSVCQSPEGKIYLCTGNGSNDKIIEIAK